MLKDLADDLIKIEMELYWRKDDKEIERKFKEIKEGNSGEEDKDMKIKTGTNIHECFKLFE